MPGASQEPDGTDLPETSPLNDFFANYHPTFEYDPTRSASLEFYRLCDVFGWDREDPDRKEAHRNFKDALVEQFNRLYGTDKDNIEHWQALCYVIRIEPVPETLTACRKVCPSRLVLINSCVADFHMTTKPGCPRRVRQSC